MKTPSDRLRLTLSVLLAVILSSMTVVLGAAPLRTLSFSLGWKKFCLMTGMIVTLMMLLDMWPMATVFLALASLSIIFCEQERKGRDFFISGFVAVMVGLLMGGVLQLIFHGFSWQSFIDVASEQVGQFVLQIKQINPKVQIESEVVLEQLPSIFVVVLIFALGLSLVLEGRLLKWLGKQREGVSHPSPLEFKMPDLFIWVLMVVFLLSFKNFEMKAVEIVSINILNILVALFFWQGVAIIATFFAVKRIGVLWQYLAYFFIVTQFFVGVTLVGVVDFWLEFRKKLQIKELLK